MATFYALDNEFAASTGKNVNNGYHGANTSQFDYPPNSTNDLTITSQEGDTSPGLFEVGETYTVQWTGGPGGGAYIEDAVVIRSDSFDETSGAIVFEGKDETGELVQVVWSPGYDLEQWYWNNYSNGVSPGFYTQDRAAGDHQVVCFAAGTRLSTPKGRIAVEDLRVGDWVHTVDHGSLPVLWKTDRRAPGVGKTAPIVVEAGLFGASDTVTLSPNHRILLESHHADLQFGSHHVYAAAKSLLGVPGVLWLERPLVRYIHLLLPVHAAVIADGLPCESLLAGDVAMGALGPCLQQAYASLAPRLGSQKAAYPCLTLREGELLAHLLAQDRMTGRARHDRAGASV